MALNFSFSWGAPVNAVERDKDGNWFYETFSSLLSNRKDVINDNAKIKTAIENPAFLKVVALNCDLYSLGKINEYSNNELKEIDFFYKLKKRPNFYQSWTQFNWEFMFYRMIFGYSVMKRNGNIINDSNNLYWLNPAKIDWGKNKAFSKMFNSIQSFNEAQKLEVTYNHLDGSQERLKLSELVFIQDLTNTCNDNFYKGTSRMDALYKIISNSDNALDAKAVNLNFAQKFLFSGKTSAENITATPMKQDEKESIEGSAKSGKNIHAVKSPVTVERFVSDIANLKLDDSYYSDFFLIGSMYNIPKDVLEASLQGSTYENQEMATGRHVEYSLKPAANAFTDAIEYTFGFEDLRMEWNHLSFNQVFEEKRVDRQKKQLENLQLAVNLGYAIPDLNERVEQILTM